MTVHATDPYAAIVNDLAYSYDGVFSRESVAAAVADARGLLEPVSTVKTFLPILVARHAKEQLTAAAQAEGRIAKAVPELLFVCVQNAGRSQMAAALLRQMVGDRVHIRTAGSRPSKQIDSMVVEVLDEIGVPVVAEFPKPLTDEVVQAADFVITMGCGDACPIYPGRRYMDWPVGDPIGQPLVDVRHIRDDIAAHLKTLCQEMDITPA